MRVLLLSFYFEPDLGPGAFRATAWARAMNERLHPGGSLDVFTTRPNRYASFAPDAMPLQHEGAMTVHRFDLPSHRSGFLDQSRAFMRYAFQAWQLSRRQRYDVVCATSSRLMTALLASLIARRQGARLFLDVRDLFVDAIGDVLPGWARPLKLILSALERLTFSRAEHINVVSGGFLPYLRERYPETSLSVITNGIDDAFLEPLPPSGPAFRSLAGRIRVLYAGNIGDGQALHLLVPDLARHLADSHEFVVVGDGGARTRLQAAIAGLSNVRWLPPVDRQTLREMYRDCDVLLLHLNDLPAFRKVLPSKLFEYAATGKPMLAGVAGYAAQFLQEIPGVASFPPCDTKRAVDALVNLHLNPVDRVAFTQKYTRRVQMQRLADIALKLES